MKQTLFFALILILILSACTPIVVAPTKVTTKSVTSTNIHTTTATATPSKTPTTTPTVTITVTSTITPTASITPTVTSTQIVTPLGLFSDGTTEPLQIYSQVNSQYNNIEKLHAILGGSAVVTLWYRGEGHFWYLVEVSKTGLRFWLDGLADPGISPCLTTIVWSDEYHAYLMVGTTPPDWFFTK